MAMAGKKFKVTIWFKNKINGEMDFFSINISKSNYPTKKEAEIVALNYLLWEKKNEIDYLTEIKCEQSDSYL